MLVVFAEMWASALRLDVTVHSKEFPPVKLSNGENSRYAVLSCKSRRLYRMTVDTGIGH